MSAEPIRTSRRIEGVTYAVRDVVLLAREAAARGRDLIYLNIGDPCQFDFRTPEHVTEAIVRALRDGRTSYAPSEGLPEAIEAIRRDAEERKGIAGVRHVIVGHGASEPIELLLTALLEPGEEVLVPRPGYPLYPAVLAKLGAVAVPYDLDEERGWSPSPESIEEKIGPRTRALVLIHPNNPTGAVADRAALERVLELCARHRLLLLSDEIYDRMLLDPVEMISPAALRDDLPVATFGGLSKVWLGPGLRIGWCILSGPERAVEPLAEGMLRLARARLCASHPVQHAVAPALFGPMDHVERTNAKLRERRDLLVGRVAALPGWSVVPPRAAFYAFPRIDLPDGDDARFVRDLILETGVVLVHGSGFGQRPGTAHVRIVFLPPPERLGEAFDRIAAYTAGRG
ncbi:MAG: aminotransferase class I/II-fold pyridoxal phosphate-dependent enzyme [Acidobacteria bacterium]|nr:MAG: aminotransferase class I/II-fold pyridoxal phosphate-dependent enzyme [Acidobacteriota bacterium]